MSTVPLSTTQSHSCHSHAVHFYVDPVAMGAHVAAFLAEGLTREAAVIVVATRVTHDAIPRHLPAHASHREGTPAYTALDADEFLSTCASHAQLSIVSQKGLSKTPCLV